MKEIDLRAELKEFNDNYGVTALYVREDKYARCRCYNTLHRTGDTSCTICGGFGHLTAIEPVKFVYDNNYYRDGEMQNKALGLTSNESIQAYMENTVRPKAKDRVYIAKWIGEVPEEISRVYIISSVDEMRMDRGRVEGYMVVANLRTDLLENANKSLATLDRKARIALGKGGRHIWPYNSSQSL